MHDVYVLYSEKFNKHYTGRSKDVPDRFLSHNDKAPKGFTVRYRPWKIILIEEYETVMEASTREKWLRSGVGRDFIKTLSHSSGNIRPNREARKN
jgi:putative endonuclease